MGRKWKSPYLAPAQENESSAATHRGGGQAEAPCKVLGELCPLATVRELSMELIIKLPRRQHWLMEARFQRETKQPKEHVVVITAVLTHSWG